MGVRQGVFEDDWSVKAGCGEKLVIPCVENEVIFSSRPVSMFMDRPTM